MSLILPFSHEKVDDTQDIIAISSNDFAPYIGFLSPSSVYIRNLELYSIPTIESFTRNFESLKNSGRNSWIQWFNKTVLFYGTSSGTIFMSRVGSLNEFKELFISKVILSTFVCHNNLGVTTATSQIYFIDSNCELNFKVNLFDVPKGIRHCTFYQPSTLSCIIDGDPYFISIDSESFMKKYEPIPKRIPISNVSLTSLSHKHNLLAVCKDNGDIILINVSPKKSQPIIAYKNDDKSEKDYFISLFWTMNENSLIAIKESGKIIIWCFSTYEVLTDNLLTSAVCVGFEHRTHRLYWSDMKGLHFIAFSAILDHYAMSSHHLVDLFKKKDVEDGGLPYEVVFSDPENVFPLIFLAAEEKHFAVASLKRVSVDGRKSLDIETVGLTFIDGFLAVFEIDRNLMKYYLSFFEIVDENDEFDVRPVGRVNFPFFPRQISVFHNEMAVLGNAKYCKVDIGTEKVESKAEEEKEEEEEGGKSNTVLYGVSLNNELKLSTGQIKYVSVKTVGFCCPLNSVFILKKNVVALLLESGDVFIAPDGPYFCKSVDCCWSFCEGGLPIVFMHSGQYTVISCFAQKVRVESFPAFTDGFRLFCLKPKISGLGKIEFDSKNFGGFFLAHLVGQIDAENSSSEEFATLDQFYQRKFPSEYPKILAEAIIKAFPIQKEMEIIRRIKKRNILTVALALALSYMPNDMKVAMLKNCDVDWSNVIPPLKGNLLYLAFSSIPFEKFVAFCDNSDCVHKVKEPMKIIERAVKENDFLRGFLFASNLNIDFCKILKESQKCSEMSLGNCISVLENEKKNCGDFEKYQNIFKFFGSSMQSGDLPLFSLATFIVLNDKIKVESVCIVDDSIIGNVQKYIKDFPDSAYRQLLEDVLKDLSSD